MKGTRMKRILATLLAAAIAALAVGTSQAQPAAKPMSDGEIRKIDKAGRKMVIKHGPLTNLDMPAMTMEFSVKDAALLDRFKAGQKIRFRAEMVGGKTTVVEAEPAKN